MKVGWASGLRIRLSVQIVVAEVPGFGLEPGRFVQLTHGKPILLGREFVFGNGRRSRFMSVSPHY